MFPGERMEATALPDHILLDIHHQPYNTKQLCVLVDEFSKLGLFEKLL